MLFQRPSTASIVVCVLLSALVDMDHNRQDRSMFGAPATKYHVAVIKAEKVAD
jgi:hypothetical protein